MTTCLSKRIVREGGAVEYVESATAPEAELPLITPCPNPVLGAGLGLPGCAVMCREHFIALYKMTPEEYLQRGAFRPGAATLGNGEDEGDDVQAHVAELFAPDMPADPIFQDWRRVAGGSGRDRGGAGRQAERRCDVTEIQKWAENLSERRAIQHFINWLQRHPQLRGANVLDIHAENHLDEYHQIDRIKLDDERRAYLEQVP